MSYQQPGYNQGYPPPPPPNYGAGYQNPQYPPGYQQPPQQTIVVVNNTENKEKCMYCQSTAGFVYQNRIGGTAIIWCVCLFCFTGVLCFLPFIMDDCKDKEVNCVSCGQTARVIPAENQDF